MHYQGCAMAASIQVQATKTVKVHFTQLYGEPIVSAGIRVPGVFRLRSEMHPIGAAEFAFCTIPMYNKLEKNLTI